VNVEPIKITERKLLLVEGQDEERFFFSLLKFMEIRDVQVIGAGGKDKMRGDFEVIVRAEGFESLESYAIARDADRDARSALASVRGLLTKHRQPVPDASGAFAESSKCKVGIYILPDGTSAGMLEDLCLRMVRDHRVMPCVDQYLNCLSATLSARTEQGSPSDGEHLFPKNEAKAKMLAFLAAMPEPVRHLGEAAQKGFLPFGHKCLEPLRTFLGRL
jgi:hypothetical protein